MKRVIHVIISIIYIICGIGAPLSALQAILAFNVPALVSATVGVIMLLAGIFGLFRIKPLKRRIFGIIIFVGAALSVVLSIGDAFMWQSVVQAVLALLYIIW